MRRRAPTPWDERPPAPELSAEEREALLRGETLKRHAHGGKSSAGLSLALSAASEAAVWATITDFAAYVEYLPYVTASWAEGVQSPEPGLEVYTWGMELTTKGVVTRYAVESHRRVQEGWMRWRMQPLGSSPMSEASGYWLTAPLHGARDRTLIVYAADVRTAWWLPTPIHRKAADRGLPAMVSLVGRRAEDR
ncbi:MAG: SRPBCC family protein [Alphaproteobacteria bacterium]|nr:SRPBCC family protein [Alphaproteobacteria bacterium]